MDLALYLRLSKEDGDLIDESNSITNQRSILQRYVEQRPELQAFQTKEYVDDGYSGKNFERPGVMRLLQDIKDGKIYGVVVKDLSRFGRNHIEVGDYIEKIFPLLDIRFIAVNNHYDSADYIGTTPDMDVAFENLMYDYFSEENSVKIKNDLIKKRRRGNFLASFAPFGYKKSPQNHNQLLVDEEAAIIVKSIFEKYAECGVKAEVARFLNLNSIPTPQEYASSKGIAQHWKYEKEKKLWSGAIVGRIIRNPIYIGDIIFHKTEALEVGSKHRKYIPKSEWEICEGTHEAIIDKELYERVNSSEFLERKGKERKEKGFYDSEIYCEGEQRRRGSNDSSIKGFVKCGGCRHCLTRRNRLNASYYCSHYYEIKSPDCCSQNIKESDLIEVVRVAVCRQAALLADLNKLLKLQQEAVKKELVQLRKEKILLQDKISKSKEESFALYEKYSVGQIDREKFQELRQKNLAKLEMYQRQLDSYEEEKDEEELEKGNVLSLLKGKEHLTELTRELVEQLISEILVYDKNRIEIIFKFKDEMENLLEITKNTSFQNKI